MDNGRHHILIIDDAPESLSAVISAMRELRWRVSVCTSGRQGFHRAQALSPDLILMDVVMPDLDGLTACRLLQASRRTRDIPVIFLSQAGDAEQRLTGLELGGVDYIVKPGLPAEVVARIRIHLRHTSHHMAVDMASGSMPLLSEGEVTLRAATQFINQNLANLPPLVEIARQVGTHDKNLSAIFRKQLGLTVFAWVREQRLLTAAEWLVDTHMSIQDIAAQVGFRSAANFATAFRKRMGLTPSEYRRKRQQTGTAPGEDGR